MKKDFEKVTLKEVEAALTELGGSARFPVLLKQLKMSRNNDLSYYKDEHNFKTTAFQVIQEHCRGYVKYRGPERFQKSAGRVFHLIAVNGSSSAGTKTFPTATSGGTILALEGRKILRLHERKERDKRLVDSKKRAVLKETGRLQCEACGFDYFVIYGKLGYQYAECHHRLALNKLTRETLIGLNDLAIVCANCHGMLHRDAGGMSVSKLRNVILRQRTKNLTPE